jgi:hypothetical protein
MTRVWWRLIPVLMTSLAVVVILIQAQPYDNLKAILMPDDCEMPCFMGLRPGESTIQQVMNTLGSSAWVSEWSWYENSPGNGSFNWNWSDSAPNVFTRPEYPFGSIKFNNGIVTDIEAKAAVPVGYLRLLMGKPERYGVMNTLGGFDTEPGLGLTMVMPNKDFWFTSVIYCPFYPHFWGSGDVSFIHWGNVDESYPESWNSLTAETYINQLKSMQQSYCRN